MTTTPESRFYATDVFDEDVDFTVVEDLKPLEALAESARSVTSRLLRSVVHGSVAATLTFGLMAGHAAVSMSPADAVGAVARETRAPRLVTVEEMTARMRDRAAIAASTFRRTAHPGADETDPDYGF